MLGGTFSSCASAMCLRTVSEYWKRSPQMRQCHWSRAKTYGRHSGLFGSPLGGGKITYSAFRDGYSTLKSPLAEKYADAAEALERLVDDKGRLKWQACAIVALI
jgi:hypothetical protein